MQDNLSVHSSMTKGKPVTVGQAAIIHHLFHRSKKKHATIAREVAGIRDVRTVARVLKQDPESYVPRAFHGRAERHDVKLRRDLIVRLVGEELTLEPDSDTDDDEPIVVGKKFATLRRLHAELRRLGHEVSLSTVARDARARGITSRVRPKVGTNTKKSRAARVAAAKRLKRLAMKKVLFCDETWANTNDNTSRCELVLPGKRPTARIHMKRAQCRLMIWAMIGYDYKSPLVFFERKASSWDDAARNITGARYSRACGALVRRALGPTGGFEHFIQDNARPHLMLAKNLKLQGHKLPVWPPYSPDLNPIETVWASLHRRVSEKHARSTAELKRAVSQAWAEFPQAEINKHVLSFRRRLEDCIDRDGEPK
jgi:hypothetical protein